MLLILLMGPKLFQKRSLKLPRRAVHGHLAGKTFVCTNLPPGATVRLMAIDWDPAERAEIEAGIEKYPAGSKRCAALARVVLRVARPRDEQARGIQLRPIDDAPWLILKEDHARRDLPRIWASHTLVETQRHDVDALTGSDGCAAEQYLGRYFEFPLAIGLQEVDVSTVDT